MPRRIAIIGGGVSGLGAAWALSRHPDRFDFRLYEAQAQLGGNAITADMPQDDGSSIPFDISVTALIPSVYQHILLVMQQHDIDLIDTRFSYSVRYRGGVYAHDFDSDIRRELQPEIEKFQKLLKRLHWFGRVNNTRSRLLNLLNPFNYVSMGTVLNWGRFSGDFRYKILKPMFVNFLMATNVFDMPASLFSRYLQFFDIEAATPMKTWDQGTRRIYEALSGGFRDRIYLNRPVRKVRRRPSHVLVEDENGETEQFDDVIFACNANQTLMMLDAPTYLESSILSSIRYESELHNHTVVHSDASVLPDSDVEALATRSNHIEQYGARPDNYEITYIMHNQQPWAKRSDKPCLVTYNAISPIDESRIIKRWWFQHVVHDVRHIAVLIQLFRFIQGKRRSWHCGAHTLINSQETCFVTGLIAARQLGADYPFEDAEAKKWFNFYGRMLCGWRFRKA
ncbi:MAG: NAD(P)-binding protein [Gammaproteobacteria bacterium]|nr:NAD(P)-binding protein [Gammaproteobacteria bacterium]MYI25362.1 NAD(P)-binding protein [Gammaproteobacteria bacterium]